jgi:enediyne biosynthesis protein E4
MTRFAGRFDVMRVLVLSAVSATAPFAGAQKANPAAEAKQPPIVFADITSKLHIALPSIAKPATLPISIPSGKYSIEYARHALVPALGGSIAVGDFNRNGHSDFYLYAVIPGGTNHLLQQNEDGSFLDVTNKAGVKGTESDLGAAFGDFDKSGHPSLFVAGLGGVTLYRNNGDGTFTDVTEKSGLKGKPAELATSVLLLDADGDGYLDVLVTIYTDLSAAPKKSSASFPNDFAGADSRLYRNQHDGTFVDITDTAGLNTNPGRTHMALAADFNKNGRMDLLLLRDNKPPALFRNMGRGKFDDQTWDAGQEIWTYAYVNGQVSDFEHNGRADAALWSSVGNEAIMNQGNGKFEQEESMPLVYAPNRAFGFHGLTADLNGDGFDDLLTIDNKGKWHFLVNHKGDFAEAPFEFSPAQGDEFSTMTIVHLGKSTEPALIGLTLDGQIKVFEKRQVGAQ